MKAIWTSVCSTFVLCCVAAFLWTAEAEMQDTDFWTDAAVISMAEVALSNVALQKAQSDAVKQFAQRMVDDHTKANQELAAAAQAKGVAIPAALPEKRQRDVTDLNGEQAGDFDREYMQMMVKDHEKAVKLFQRQAERGTDADAKAFAARVLPALQEHLTMARSLYDTTRAAARGNSSNVNRSTNVRQDTNRNDNSNGNNNRGYSNRRPNVNANANGNTNANTNSNRRNNTNTGNANNSNAGNMNDR